MTKLQVKFLKNQIKLVAASVLAVTAAGCGGGGGGGSPAPVAVAPTTTTTAATTTAAPKALLMYIPVSSGVAGTAVMPTAASDLTLTRTTTPSYTVTATATGNLASGQSSASTAALNDLCSTPGVTVGGTCTYGSGSSGLSISKSYGAGNLAYATYGTVQLPNGTSGYSYGGYHNGTPTATSSMPTNVTATYTGLYAGTLFTPGTGGTTNVGQQNGTANLTANFTNSTVAGTVTNLTTTSAAVSAVATTPTTTAAGYGLGMNGTISGSSYTGTAGYNNGTNSTAAGTVTASGLTGGFYGPGAAETAGALMVKGTDPSGKSSPSITVGAFGAKKN
jgi:C-lobe and N-lobe beta barrels of Tf-binding protein B